MILAIFAVIWFFLIHPVYALSPPILSDPPNNSVIYSGPKLSWQAVIDSMGYKIMIDDEPSFTSPYAKTPYYTENTYYSPKLNAGNYYWKVGAKDSSGTWFWSDVWFFTLSTSSPSPTPTATPTPTLNASPTPSSATSSFTISNIPSQINSDQSFTVSVNLSIPNNPNTAFYLKGAFKKSDSSNYFGQTLVSGNWVKNGSTYSNQYPVTTDTSGNWSGNLEIKPDSEDAGFTDTGDYIFKVGRYTSTGSGPTWSNESNIKIVSTISDQGTTLTNNPSSITNPPSSPQSVKNVKSRAVTSYRTASVAAATISTSSSPSAQIKGTRVQSILPWVGAIFIFCGISSLIFIYLRIRKIL